MAKMKLKVDGIFDENVFQFFLEKGVKDFIFDLRPLSFNFIQQYVFMRILEQEVYGTTSFSFKFEKEKEFVIEKFLIDIFLFFPRNRFDLTFSDGQTFDFYDQFKIPYWVEFSDWQQLEKSINGHFLKGVILPLAEVIKMRQRGDGSSPALKINKMRKSTNEIKIALQTSWQRNFIDCDLIKNYKSIDFVLKINDEITQDYRVIDVKKASFFLDEIKSI